MAHDVFLSHTHEDSVAAAAICKALEASGVRCWIAPRDVRPGADWQQSIMDAIAASKAMVLIFSSHTNTSEHVKREVTAAVDASAVIIPFRIENVLPEGALRYNLNRVQWLDAYVPPMEPHIGELVRTLSTVPGVEATTTLVPPMDDTAAALEAGRTAAQVPPRLDDAPGTPHEEPKPKDAPEPITVQVPNLLAMWAAASSGTKIATATAAVLALVLLGFGVNSLRHGTHAAPPSPASSAPSPSSAAASSVAASNSAAPASSDSASSDILPITDDRHVVIYNDTGGALEHFYASNTQLNQWGGEDLLGASGTIASKSSQKLNLDDGTGHCLFDFKATFADGSDQTAHAVDVCRVSTYHFTTGDQSDRHVVIANDTASPITNFYASNVQVTNWGGEDLLGSTGVIAPSGNVNLNIDDGSGNCLFDFKAQFGNGDTQTEGSVDVCHVGVFHFIK